MDVLIVADDPGAQVALAQEVIRRGMGVICMSDLDSAEAMLRHQVPRALILSEWVGGRLSHRLALMAECRRPDVAVILLTGRSGADLNELPDLIPALCAILGRDFAPDAIGQILAAVLNRGGTTRVSLRTVPLARMPEVPAPPPQPDARALPPDCPAIGVPELPPEMPPEMPSDSGTLTAEGSGAILASGPAAVAPWPLGRVWSVQAYQAIGRRDRTLPDESWPETAVSAPRDSASAASVTPPVPLALSRSVGARHPVSLQAVPLGTEPRPAKPDPSATEKPGRESPHREPSPAAPVLGTPPPGRSPQPRSALATSGPAAFDWPAWLAAAAATQEVAVTPPVPRAAASPTGAAAPVFVDWKQPPPQEPGERPRLTAGGRRLTLG